jgi:tetratricopeptide (TPR) repeat protein
VAIDGGARNTTLRGRGRRTRPTGRPWCIPPVMVRDPGEGLERAAVLEEWQGDLGVLLWRTVRDVELWACTQAERRAELFHPGSGDHRLQRLVQTEIPPELTGPLDTLTAMLSAPERADDEVLASCCLRIAGWADGAGAAGTALAYAQAAALAVPDDGDAALQTGGYALRAGQRARAEVWLRRAVGLGRRARQREPYVRALLALAQFRERASSPARSIRDYRFAHRAGLRYGVREVRLGAARALLRLSMDAGDVEAGRRWAVEAQRAYRPGVPDAAALLLELARFWIDAGREENAVPALRRLALRERGLNVADRLSAMAMRARAHASAGEGPALARHAAAEAFTLLADPTVAAPVQLKAAMDLAHAAAAQRDERGFARAVHAALRLASHAEYARTRERLASLARARGFAVPLLEGAV